MNGNEKWTVKQLSEFVEPYYSSQDNDACRHLNVEEWEVKNAAKVLQVAKDLLDVPAAELSIEEIRKDFEAPEHQLPESTLVGIQNYYNGRLALWNSINKDIEEFAKLESRPDKVFHYDIPAEYNSFAVYVDSRKVEQKQAYIEIAYKA